MITIDGREFDNLVDAQAYLDEKKAEESEKKQLEQKKAEEKAKKVKEDKIKAWVSEKLYCLTAVKLDGTAITVCVFCDSREDAKKQLHGKIDEMFGAQFERKNSRFECNYEVIGTYKPSTLIKNMVVNSLLEGDYSYSAAGDKILCSIRGLDPEVSNANEIFVESFCRIPDELVLYPEVQYTAEEQDLYEFLEGMRRVGFEPLILRGFPF